MDSEKRFNMKCNHLRSIKILHTFFFFFLINAGQAGRGQIIANCVAQCPQPVDHLLNSVDLSDSRAPHQTLGRGHEGGEMAV